MNTIKEFVEEAVRTRSSEIVNEISQEDETCRKLSKDIIRLEADLIGNLGDKEKLVYDELKDALYHRESVVVDAVYRQGIVDGVGIAKML